MPNVGAIIGAAWIAVALAAGCNSRSNPAGPADAAPGGMTDAANIDGGGADAGQTMPSNGTGRPCTKNSDCPSGICLPDGAGNVCTTTCTTAADCVDGWTCGAELGQSSNICQCSSSAEVCDGKDNDCDGIVDNEPVVDESCRTQNGTGYVCNEGSCACSTMCGDECVDTKNDVNNCGSCGNACTTGWSCDDGSCAPIVAVSSGDYFACAVTMAGGVKCWGHNAYGVLGNGTTTDSATPVDVTGLTTGVSSVSVSDSSACVVTTAGGVKCWGSLGSGTTPVDVMGLTSGVRALSVGSYSACAVTTAGGVKCWGNNFHGELGNGTTTSASTPVDVTGLTSDVSAVSVGYYSGDGINFVCAVTTAGGVKCWGLDEVGELGDGAMTDSSTPVDVVGLTSGVDSVSAGGGFACAVMTAGGVKCWGYNGDGELGSGTTAYASSTPVDVTGLTSGVNSVSAGSHSVCAVTTTGGVTCWGGYDYGYLGLAMGTVAPVDVAGLGSGVNSVSVGQVSNDYAGLACVIMTAGSVECWGRNMFGDLGTGPTTLYAAPADVVF